MGARQRDSASISTVSMGPLAAEILAYVAGELRWAREELGEERRPRVHVAHEKEIDERNAREEDDIMRLVNRDRYR